MNTPKIYTLQAKHTILKSYICIVALKRKKMKVTAIIPDDIVSDIQKFTNGKNITDSLIKALNDWLYTKRIEHLSNKLAEDPVEFKDGFTAEGIRKLNNGE